jgi:hypothetical protein
MSLDAKTLHAALRKLLPDMAPSISYVEDYIRAFYLPPQVHPPCAPPLHTHTQFLHKR